MDEARREQIAGSYPEAACVYEGLFGNHSEYEAGKHTGWQRWMSFADGSVRVDHTSAQDYPTQGDYESLGFAHWFSIPSPGGVTSSAVHVTWTDTGIICEDGSELALSADTPSCPSTCKAWSLPPKENDIRFHCPVWYSLYGKNTPASMEPKYAPYQQAGKAEWEAMYDEWNTNDACFQAAVDSVMFGYPAAAPGAQVPRGFWCPAFEAASAACSTRGSNNCQSLNLDAAIMQTPTRYYCDCGAKPSEQECLALLPGAHEHVRERTRERREREREAVAKRGRVCVLSVCVCVRCLTTINEVLLRPQ